MRRLCQAFGVLVADWLLLVSGWPHDALGSLDTLRLVRTHIPLLMGAFSQPSLCDCLFGWLRDDLRHASRLSKRRKVPLAFQLWHGFEASGA
jgi:hypothetical protein